MLNFSSPQSEFLQNTAFNLLLLEMQLPTDGLAAGGVFLCHDLAHMPQPLHWIGLLLFSAIFTYSFPLSVHNSNFPLSKLVFFTFPLHLALYFSATFSSFPISNDNTRLKRQVYSHMLRAYLTHFQRQAQCWGQRNQTGSAPWNHLPSVQTHHTQDKVLWASTWEQGLTVGSSKGVCCFSEANMKQNYRTPAISLLLSQWHSETWFPFPLFQMLFL